MRCCGRESVVHNAGGCPRYAGHSGECYWWLSWSSAGAWRVIVYSGDPRTRRRRCRGVFTAEPELEDVNQLVRTIAVLRKRELARCTPESEPQPEPGPEPFVFESGPRGTIEAVREQEQLQVL